MLKVLIFSSILSFVLDTLTTDNGCSSPLKNSEVQHTCHSVGECAFRCAKLYFVPQQPHPTRISWPGPLKKAHPKATSLPQTRNFCRFFFCAAAELEFLFRSRFRRLWCVYYSTYIHTHSLPIGVFSAFSYPYSGQSKKTNALCRDFTRSGFLRLPESSKAINFFLI